MPGGKQHFFVSVHFTVAAEGKGLEEFSPVISGE